MIAVTLANDAYFTVSFSLNSTTYSVDFKENTADKTYYLSVFTDEQTIVASVKALANLNFLEQVTYKDANLQGSLFLKESISKTGVFTASNFANFTLVYDDTV